MIGPRSEPPGLAWDWSLCLLGVVLAAPALAVIPFNELAGLGLALGVLPAAVYPLPVVRRARRVIPLLGVLCGTALVLGSLLTQLPALAVPALFCLALGASLTARVSRLGALLLLLALPLTAIGLSLDDLSRALVAGGLMLAGSLYAWLVALAWPERPAAVARALPERPTVGASVVYGVLLGLAGASAAAVGYLLGFEHVGWAAGAALLIMRPDRHQLIRRSVGRAISVVAGALAAALFAIVSPVGLGTAIAVTLALACLTATQASRWYIAPAFTSFIALTLLLDQGGEGPGAGFTERTVDTFLGVAAALLFGAAAPAVLRVLRDRRERGRAH